MSQSPGLLWNRKKRLHTIELNDSCLRSSLSAEPMGKYQEQESDGDSRPCAP